MVALGDKLKVVRGGNDTNESPVEAIEIPPPRPKRKPTHPYPRKIVDSQNNTITPSFQPEKRICPHIATIDSENQSPNSVLSAVMSHLLELPVSEVPDSCLSTSSCSTDLQSGSLYSIDKEDNLKAINSVQYTGIDAMPTIKRSVMSTEDNLANIGNGSSEEEADLAEATVMLFGQILYKKDSQRSSTDRKGTFRLSEQHLEKTYDNKHGKLVESSASNGLDGQSPHGMYYGNWRPWSWHEMNSDSKGGNTCQWMSLPLHRGLPSPYLISCVYAPTRSFVEERTYGKEPCASMVKNESTEETKDTAYAVNKVTLLDTPSLNHSYKSGFVPYKRCFTAGGTNSDYDRRGGWPKSSTVPVSHLI
uniref:Uncharacterized protein n=1 Tax=Kalanchoe fedtschenkoi TaxID=63787 RepID=A0A7N0THK1_KALFE